MSKDFCLPPAVPYFTTIWCWWAVGTSGLCLGTRDPNKSWSGRWHCRHWDVLACSPQESGCFSCFSLDCLELPSQNYFYFYFLPTRRVIQECSFRVEGSSCRRRKRGKWGVKLAAMRLIHRNSPNWQIKIHLSATLHLVTCFLFVIQRD